MFRKSFFTAEVNKVDLRQLRVLLHELKDHRNDIFIRFRFLGSMWQPTFFRIANVTEKGVVLEEVHSRKPIMISDLRNVVQFEIDSSFKEYVPNNHYDLRSLN